MEKPEEIIPAQAAAEEPFITRWDRTQELLVDRDVNRWKRRLDSIARLIENGAVCAAITIKGDSFLIATNKEYPRGEETKDQSYKLIDDVMGYFRGIAIGQDPQQRFEDIFTKICIGAMRGLQLPASTMQGLIEANFIKKVIDSTDARDYRFLRDLISEQIENGHCPGDEAAAFVTCLALLKDFKKVVNFICKNKGKDDESAIASFIKAIKSYTEQNIITAQQLQGRVADTKDMHAEMRLIAFLESDLRDKKKKHEYYIGISKLCCLDCHAIIYAVNNAEYTQDGDEGAGKKSIKYGHQISTRGAHNVMHSDHWRAPFGITGEAARLSAPTIPIDATRKKTKQNSKPEPFTTEIVERFVEAREKATQRIVEVVKGKEKISETVGASGVSEYAAYSQSSSEDESEERVVKQFLYTLQGKRAQLSLLASSKIPGVTIDKRTIDVIDKLLTDINNKETKLNGWIELWRDSDIIKYLRDLNKGNPLTDLDQITKIAIAIFINSDFVGEVVANKFKPILNAIVKSKARQQKVVESISMLHMPYDALEIKEVKLTGSAAELKEILQQALTADDVTSKEQIVTALNLLLQRDDIEPVLQFLNIQQRHVLIQMLNFPPFIDKMIYNSLRIKAKEVQTAAFIEFLLVESQKEDGKGLHTFIDKLCQKNLPPSLKEEFLDVLRIMELSRCEDLRKILEVISKNSELSKWLVTEIERKFSTPEHAGFIGNVTRIFDDHRQKFLVQPDIHLQEILQDRAARRPPVQEADDGMSAPKAKHSKL